MVLFAAAAVVVVVVVVKKVEMRSVFLFRLNIDIDLHVQHRQGGL